MTDRHYWITGAYEPVAGGDWVSFAYGPFHTQDEADDIAESYELVQAALGSVAGAHEIDCTDPITYGQACKHFEETIMSDHFSVLLPESYQLWREECHPRTAPRRGRLARVTVSLVR